MFESEVQAATGKNGKENGGAVAPPTAPLPLPCLLDQRLDDCFELFTIDRLITIVAGSVRARRPRRGCNAHEGRPYTVKLL